MHANPFRYGGQYYDKDTGLYYLRTRYYDPVIGRFTQEDPHWNTGNMIYGDDPVELTSGAYAPSIAAIVQSGNRYPYAMNNPVKYVDENGESVKGALLLAALNGTVVGGTYVVEGKDFKNGFANGFTSAIVTEAGIAIGVAAGHPYVGAAVGSIFGSAAGSLVEDVLFNPNADITEIAKNAGSAAALGVISATSTVYWKYALHYANEAANVAKVLMEYDKNLGTAIEVFFSEVVAVLSVEVSQ